MKHVFVFVFFIFEGVGDVLELDGVLLEGVDEGVELADASRFDAVADDEVANPEVVPMIAGTPFVVVFLRRRLTRLLRHWGGGEREE